jgi:hypothetical protein
MVVFLLSVVLEADASCGSTNPLKSTDLFRGSISMTFPHDAVVMVMSW